MAVKIFTVLMACLSMLLVILSIQEPYFLDLQTQNMDIKETQMNDIMAYELNSSAVSGIYRVKEWQRYKDKDVLVDFTAFGLDYNFTAQSTTILGRKNQEFIFEGDVFYKDNNQTQIKGQKFLYNSASKLLSSSDEVLAYIGENIINTQDFSYDLNTKQMTMQGVKAWLQR